ncbi:acyl-CoA dehydrogenase family protein [Nonomuraea recticatena]|uniref:acyl-CoA dehydrogenase family protein n=1 Tax=Nonomuraea recticatena TaxID=46178 RepID=UPI003622DE81
MTLTGTVPATAAGTGPVTDRRSARAFVDTHVVPYADAYDRSGRVPEELLRRVAEAGLWAPFLPPDSGGAGMDMVTLGEIHEEVGRGCSSLRSLLTVHTMVSWTVQRWGTPEQRERWTAALGRGDTLGAFCLSEPSAGSDAAGITTTATQTGAGWVINGVKKWTTGGQRADVFLVFARTPTSIGAFLVPKDTPGWRSCRSTTCSAPAPPCWRRSPSRTWPSAPTRCSDRAASPPAWS